MADQLTPTVPGGKQPTRPKLSPSAKEKRRVSRTFQEIKKIYEEPDKEDEIVTVEKKIHRRMSTRIIKAKLFYEGPSPMSSMVGEDRFSVSITPSLSNTAGSIQQPDINPISPSSREAPREVNGTTTVDLKATEASKETKDSKEENSCEAGQIESDQMKAESSKEMKDEQEDSVQVDKQESQIAGSTAKESAAESKMEKLRTENVDVNAKEYDSMKPDEVKLDEVKPDEVKPDEVKPDEVKTDEVKADWKTQADGEKVEGDFVDETKAENSAGGDEVIATTKVSQEVNEDLGKEENNDFEKSQIDGEAQKVSEEVASETNQKNFAEDTTDSNPQDLSEQKKEDKSISELEKQAVVIKPKSDDGEPADNEEKLVEAGIVEQVHPSVETDPMNAAGEEESTEEQPSKKTMDSEEGTQHPISRITEEFGLTEEEEQALEEKKIESNEAKTENAPIKAETAKNPTETGISRSNENTEEPQTVKKSENIKNVIVQKAPFGLTASNLLVIRVWGEAVKEGVVVGDKILTVNNIQVDTNKAMKNLFANSPLPFPMRLAPGTEETIAKAKSVLLRLEKQERQRNERERKELEKRRQQEKARAREESEAIRPADKVIKKGGFGYRGTRYIKLYKEMIYYAHDPNVLDSPEKLEQLAAEYNSSLVNTSGVKKKIKKKNCVIIPMKSVSRIKKSPGGYGITLTVKHRKARRTFTFEAEKGSDMFDSWSEVILKAQGFQKKEN